MFAFRVPTSAWQTDAGYDVLKLDIVSGSTCSANLGPGRSFDCVDLLT
ncbi:hypothetical protein GCM10011579_041200 [Streptomyces albiflavescens]|uniref:Uncharacterized protein n=1 Tax=Streptomyces albiflavescens TaxID=1623582 RepID=A0A917Y5U5_9ACTN|nr:hypothetical protein [Streptomyces albiflavescens]GGN68089.1 hypothetical protein GCM10011579_041200 [Streptomyces albiflavescens]